MKDMLVVDSTFPRATLILSHYCSLINMLNFDLLRLKKTNKNRCTKKYTRIIQFKLYIYRKENGFSIPFSLLKNFCHSKKMKKIVSELIFFWLFQSSKSYNPLQTQCWKEIIERYTIISPLTEQGITICSISWNFRHIENNITIL